MIQRNICFFNSNLLIYNIHLMNHQEIESKVIKEEVIFESKWLGLKYTTYSVGDKVIPNYETVYRTTTKNKGLKIDGVEVVPIIKYAGQQKESEIIMIANFRAPVNNFVIEFPSGLAESEDFEANAKREVLQQTGYVISSFIKIPLPVMVCDPWKSNESGFLYLGVINGDDPNHRQQQQLQKEENIRVYKFGLKADLMKEVNELIEKKKYVIQSKAWVICLGLCLMGLLNPATDQLGA